MLQGTKRSNENTTSYLESHVKIFSESPQICIMKEETLSIDKKASIPIFSRNCQCKFNLPKPWPSGQYTSLIFSTDILVAADSILSGAKISQYVEFRTCDVLRMAQYKPLVHMEFFPVDNWIIKSKNNTCRRKRQKIWTKF